MALLLNQVLNTDDAEDDCLIICGFISDAHETSNPVETIGCEYYYYRVIIRLLL